MKTIFVSYVREDESWRDRVLLALEGLRRGGRLTLWYDVGLRSGERWSPEILRQLNRADAFLVLASEAYQRSAYIRGTEFPRIEERVGRGEARLFWVPIDLPSDAGEAEGPLAFLREYQAAHGSREPLERLNEQGGAHLSNALLRVDSQFKAWASDGLRASAGHPRPDPAPPLSLDDLGRVERRYLNEVVRDVQYLKVSGLGSPPGESGRALRRLPLESVYITLRADPTTLADRLQTRALHRELAALGADGGARGEDGREPHARPKTPQEIIAERGPHAAEPDPDPGEAELVLEDAFRDERVLVILGDPGSGKSVLCRWLALQLARRSLASWGLGPAGPADASALGPPRLPILLRVADLNGWLRAHVEARGAGQTPDLMEAIGTHGAAGVEEVAPREAAALFRAAIEEKRAVVLLDGLDEVPDAGDRELITDALEAFATRWVLDPGGVRRQGRPGDTGGNQLVVTSRVTGYHLAPLRFESDVAAHYRIRPLDDERVRRFCAHVARLFDEQRPDEALGRQLLEDLELSLLPGLDRLKRNPLLLTSLISYWYPRRRLPRSRAELYHALLLDLCARWRSMDATLDGVSETLRAWVADDERLLDLLGVVAREIHLEHPSGQIARPALERFVRDRLVARVTGTVSLEMEARDAEEDVRALMILMSTQVGALVEVGPDIFRFLHLTFQEYLVGRDLVRGLAADGAEEALAEAFLERLDEPRWREPVLFAFGELGLPDAPGSRRVDRGTVLRALRQSGLRRRQAAAPAALGLLIADLVAELSPEEVGAEDVTETIWALAEAYRSYGPSPEVEEQRLRVAERLAELRRAAPGSEAVDREVRALVASRDELAPALAHLYWERRWLVPGVLDAFAARLGADAGEWGWPMHAALRWALLPPEGRITPEPVETLTVTPPNDPDGDPGRARRRFERAYPVWERMKRAHGERVLDTAFPAERFPLRAFFAEDPARWERLLSDPADARAAVALLAPVDDWRSAYWRREYLQLAQFLQRSDIVREATIDAQPEAFLPRWGRSGDIIYDCAVYLDVNDTTSGRFRFYRERRVELRPDLAARALPAPLAAALRRRAAPGAAPGSLRRGLIEHALAEDEAAAAAAAAALVGAGVEVDDAVLARPEVRRALALGRDALADAALRAVFQNAARWFAPPGGANLVTPAEHLGPAERVAVYHAAVRGVVASSRLTPPDVLTAPDGPLSAEASAATWAKAFAREGDDPVYLFAVCLDTILPKRSGWRSSLPVLSRICTTPTGELLASRVLLPAAPLWGVSPDEHLVPPGCLDVLRHLSVAASTIHPEFGDAFADGFQPASPFPGLSRGSVDGWGFPAELAGGDGVGAEAAPDAVRALLEGADPLTTATVLELALGGAPPDDRQLRRVREAAAALLGVSPIDAVLFLARMASAFPGHGFADGWLEDALRETGRLPAEEVRAEVLARLRGRVAHDPALRKLHGRLAREIGSPVLRAHAEGRLGRFLASPAFAWNAPELLGGDPAWTVAAVHAALSEAARHAGAAEDPDLLWAELARTPGAETLERLLEAAAERGLLCSPAAAAAVDALRALPAEARRELLPERVYPHLQRPTGSTLRHLGRWLEGAGSGEAEDALLAGQAAVLLAESTRELRPEWVGPLFTAVERGDDYQGGRAELALAGPWRHVERENRRFRTSRQGVPALRALADRLHASYGSAGDGALAHVAICAINDWWVDAPEPLARWCAEADASPAAEGALLAAVHACDLWSPECQRTVAEWLCAEGVEEARRDRRRGMMLAWVARQHFHKHALPEPALLERLEGAALSALREVRTLPCIGKDLVHHALVADACAAAAEAAVGKSAAARAAEHLDGRLVPVFGPDGKLDPEALATLGQSYYSWIGQWPEVAFPHVRVHLDNPSFRRVLADWLRSTLDEWMQARAGDDTPVSRILLTRLDALLGFAVCLSGHNEAAFTRLCEPEDFLAPLAAVCLWQPSALAHMSAVTLISRMRRVDLDLAVDDGDGRAPTVLDALLAGLRGRTEVQERLAVALPGIVEFQGVRVVDRLRSILAGDSPEGERTPLASGSEVMAAADLLAKMLRRGTLRDPAVRRRALDALREATASPRNRRPLFRKLGYGNEGDPVGMVRVGSLAHELMGVVARL